MARPQAYDPQDGYKYQILCRNQQYSRAYEHCDYATDKSDKNHLVGNYRLAYGAGWEFKVILLPRKYWPKPDALAELYAGEDEVLARAEAYQAELEDQIFG